MMNRDQKHEFSIFIKDLKQLPELRANKSSFQITDKQIFHRLQTVLRIQPGQQVTFFDQHITVQTEINDYKKPGTIIGTVIAQNLVKQLSPSLTILLPLLKKEALEESVYGLTEVGVNTIQLITTAKIHKNSWAAHEHERAERLIIAAAEQAKQYAVPQLLAPISLAQALTKYQDPLIFCDPNGTQTAQVMAQLTQQKPTHLVMLIGPEGDLTSAEKESLPKQTLTCALTPTILRAPQAVILAAGMIRTLIR